MSKVSFEDRNHRRHEVTAVNNERVHTEGTRDVTVKLNCENSNAVKTIKEVYMFGIKD
jgi:hypothetical protein